MAAAASEVRAFALNCTLKPSPAESSTDRLLDSIADELATHDIKLERARLADHRIVPGVTADEGEGDEWPTLRRQVVDADIFVLATPIWMGHPASPAQVALERLDAFLGEQDERQQMGTVDKVAMVAVVGNEDGAHHVSAELFQGLNDVGFTIPANALTYWVGEAMHTVDLKDLDEIPPRRRLPHTSRSPTRCTSRLRSSPCATRRSTADVPLAAASGVVGVRRSTRRRRRGARYVARMDYERPRGTSDATVHAVGTATEALEHVERARGHLYEAHQLLGHADLTFGDAVDQLRAAGHAEVADRLDREVVGRNVLDGRWTFQIVDEFDSTYYDVVRDAVRSVEEELMGGRRHVFEAEMKDRRRSAGHDGHERRPPAVHDHQ